ncbi:MAG: MBL fold metallo-hydrolase [Cyclobacteriaceae bacterium]|nr:MBL fold metallo-hydrolase [Cyclobacteriaceae bacterium]
MKWTYACLILITLLGTACTHSISKFYPEIVPAKSDVPLVVNSGGKSQMNLVYLGCGNMILEHDGEAIMTDPFFSNQKLLKLLGKIKSNPTRYNTWKTNLEYFLSPSVVNAALVSHTHYDHAMDLPLMLEDRYFNSMRQVYGNSYLPKMMQHFSEEGSEIHGLSGSQVYDPTMANDQNYEWISTSSHIRFLSIHSNHAPHTKKKLYMDKPLDENYFEENLIYSNSKTKAFKWTNGETYSFLVDFIGSDTLRVFIQTSASQYPNGFPPKSELLKKPVDLAIICYASGLNVDNYPKALFDFVQPRKMMLVHWEDFFRTPKSFEDQRLVRRTNPRKMRKQIDALKKKSDYFIMPRPGTRVKITY